MPQAGTRFTLGRATHNDYQIDCAKISRTHAEIMVTEKGVCVRDLGSFNGTYINNRQISGMVNAFPGDIIRFADLSFILCYS